MSATELTRSCFLHGFMLALLLVLPVPALAQRQAPESDLKAAILANMLHFVEWPESGLPPRGRLAICYFSDSAVATALVRLDGKVLRNQQLSTIRTDATRLAQCHAVYLAPDDVAQFPDVLPALRAGGVLLTGDTPGLLDHGVMINLELVAGRVVFDVHLGAVRRAGLTLSSKALRLARTVLE
ncbi:MAG: YfiR family protein [Azoarcus sp.]|nr:YfiR family protein [Azoarcus sp.]